MSDDMNQSIMVDVDVVFKDSIPSFDVQEVGLNLSVATCKAENAVATNNRQLSDFIKNLIPSQQTQITPIVLAFREAQVKHHQQPNLFLHHIRVRPLGLPHHLRIRIRAFGKRVIRHHHRPKKRLRRVCYRCLRHSHRRGILPAQDVVEVEMKMGQLLFLMP